MVYRGFSNDVSIYVPASTHRFQVQFLMDLYRPPKQTREAISHVLLLGRESKGPSNKALSMKRRKVNSFTSHTPHHTASLSKLNRKGKGKGKGHGPSINDGIQGPRERMQLLRPIDQRFLPSNRQPTYPTTIVGYHISNHHPYGGKISHPIPSHVTAHRKS